MDNVNAGAKMARVYMAAGFGYLLVGTILLALTLSEAIQFNVDAIFIMQLYGFVVMLIFGLSYVFAPGLSHAKYADYRTIIVEFVLLNAGVIVLVSSLSGYITRSTAQFTVLPALVFIILSVLIHVSNIWYIIGSKKLTAPRPPQTNPQSK